MTWVVTPEGQAKGIYVSASIGGRRCVECKRVFPWVGPALRGPRGGFMHIDCARTIGIVTWVERQTAPPISGRGDW
jgi:hypothetical protein